MLEDARRKLDTLLRFRSGTWTANSKSSPFRNHSHRNRHPRSMAAIDSVSIDIERRHLGEITISRSVGVIGQDSALLRILMRACRINRNRD